MSEMNIKQNNAPQDRSKKPLIVAVSVICALSVILIAFLACKNSVLFAISESKAEKGKYAEAMHYIENINTEKSEALSLYLSLRNDINESYPVLLTDFQTSIISQWTEKVTAVEQVKHLLSDEIASQADVLAQTLHQVNSCLTQYGQIRYDILSLMDVFAELNRLYSKDISGKNTAFTVSEERIKITSWEQQLSTLVNFAYTVPKYENIYLLNYLIKEVEGECLDLRTAMDSVIAMGYKETDLIRLSGSAQKQFPAITNSNNESVNLLQKEKYESYMYDGICIQLAEVLGEFYEV
ncbi:MAG: hypothetical protein IJB16_08330 [Clostridia bacterium]|nr:hypothetical protein [Clostridia bacterium]